MSNKPKVQTSKVKQYVQAYLDSRPLFFACIRPQEAYLFNYLNKYISQPILDFGCGDGFFASLVWPKKAINVGLDISQSRIIEAKDKPVYQQLQTYDGQTIPQPDANFATVVSNCVFEHLPDLTGNLAEMYRILKPGGYLLTSVMADKWENYLVGKHLLGKKYIQFMRRQQVHQNILSHSQWQQRFEKTGFQVVEAIGYLDKPTAQHMDLSHYLAIPSLLNYKLFHRWQLIPGLFHLLGIDKYFTLLTARSLFTPVTTSAAIFFVLQKPTSATGSPRVSRKSSPSGGRKR